MKSERERTWEGWRRRRRRRRRWEVDRGSTVARWACLFFPRVK